MSGRVGKETIDGIYREAEALGYKRWTLCRIVRRGRQARRTPAMARRRNGESNRKKARRRPNTRWKNKKANPEIGLFVW